MIVVVETVEVKVTVDEAELNAVAVVEANQLPETVIGWVEEEVNVPRISKSENVVVPAAPAVP